MIIKIDTHSYKAFRESIQDDRLIKLINLMLRSAECGFRHRFMLTAVGLSHFSVMAV